ncbi:TPA: 1-deoxy-D-xylulose-5-phosphate synthase, partial [bacterium]|nr:1-deoxy-D-xylulose-5-phosphate synthase [bacterium]
LQNLPVVFALDRAGLVGADGPTHHGTFDFAYLRHIPNMVVMAPKDEAELQHMLKTAIEYDGPIALRYPRGEGIGAQIPDELLSLPIGKAELIKDGNDILLLAIGSMVYPAIQSAENLEKEGISTAVVNARFVKPLNRDLIIPLAKRIGRVITIEEHAVSCGFGSAVAEMITEQDEFADIQIKMLGLPDQFVEHGDHKLLLSKYGLTSEGITQSAIQMIQIESQILNLSS